MKIIKCRAIPRQFAVNLFGTIWVRDPSWIDKKVINHERIHSAQQRELLWLPFYLLYFLEWLVRLIICRNFDKAYRSISFEKEAYTHDHDLEYLKHRKSFSQWRPRRVLS